MDQLTAAVGVATVIATLIAGFATARVHTTSGSADWVQVVVVAVTVAALTPLAYLSLVSFNVGPFKTREVEMTGGGGDQSCVTTLEGSVKVPEGEDLWVLLFDDSSGEFWIHGPGGGPVASGKDERAWTLPIAVSDQYYANARYSAFAVLVPYVESVKLAAQADGPLPPEALPDMILDYKRLQITLTSSVLCPVKS